ncbi:putative transcriptional regulator, TetR family [Commensalibacter intestini A911]|uniref:TetR family transcriptional regulator n=2 Tax=Commensalibacter intestini TaxID=479936 RepID=A0A251ZX32_9PROT|nr:TetR/AcrR family transcriptional regulator [Commensalibacter intestini]EHD13859.1 putative transcriptional regulator, TetR family [Commensalibacter intestini A911]OUI79211.1 TetR family transcriptional regulator [Commensalibacter intestini]
MVHHQEKKADTRQKIIVNAAKCFAEKGYEGCSISDISKAAQISQGSIYVHFTNKEELFLYIIIEDHMSAAKKLQNALVNAPSFDVLLATLMECIRDVSYPIDHRLWTEILAQATRNSTVRSAFLASDKIMREAFINLLKKAIELGQVDAHGDLETVSIWIYAVVDGLIARTAYDPNIDLERQLPVFETLIRKALGAKKQ